ncbi:hypothetical protein [Marinifilum sp. D714]|uniref:hypothetical protein n=1 Tax=Marinifilum sp. D714 TaxID=2937523 RepID=UPI0027BB9DC4|nr:hypothetical protein [Marinifilum sp. D714]MDQ2178794.1 hypothetical protein [Marinifilum sp. D714]
MSVTLQVLIIIISSGGFSSLLYFIFQRWYQKQLDKNLETHKGDIRKEIDTQLESHKGDIQKDLEHLKDSYIKENLESTRFVEVICRQRITWLDQLREDITEIVSKTHLFVEISQKHLQELGVNVLAKGIEMFQDEKFSAGDAGNVINTSINNTKESLPIKTEVVAAITRLKLKLNPLQDFFVIELLDSLRDLIEYPTDNSTKISVNLNQLQTEGQNLIKHEWKRVKKEVKIGKETKSTSYYKPQSPSKPIDLDPSEFPKINTN